MANNRLRKELLESMAALERVGAVSGATMREFEKDLVGKVPILAPEEIQNIREKYQISQSVFAALLNVTSSTVQKWEQGQKTPSAPALKLLQIVSDHGLGILVPKES